MRLPRELSIVRNRSVPYGPAAAKECSLRRARRHLETIMTALRRLSKPMQRRAAIFIAIGAGLKIFWTVLVPGPRTRVESRESDTQAI